jgi:hypothetical protein
MDSNEFLSYFWELSDQHTNEQILKAAEGIVNLIDAKQKFEKGEKEIDRLKYKLYLDLCENPTQDLLYTFKRLVIAF